VKERYPERRVPRAPLPDRASSTSERREPAGDTTAGTARRRRDDDRRRRARRAGLARLALLLAVGTAIPIAIVQFGGDDTRVRTDPGRIAGEVRLVVDGRRLATAPSDELDAGGARSLAALLDRVPATRVVRRGPARVSLRVDRPELRRRVLRAVAAGGGTVAVPERAVASTARLPIVKQAFRNNCETAALSMLLAGRGVRVNQRTLQRQLPRSGPLDPQPSPDGGLETWGDPTRGYVGRVDGGGTAGGYGVYERPIRALARRHSVALRDLTRRAPRDVYRRLAAGNPVMVWIGLSDGPFRTWRSPAGGEVTANFGEHTVVLTGLRGNRLYVNDPLTGQRLTWTKAYFEDVWPRLGRRALSL
jgi:uncharacterized protein YvpB